MNECRRRIGVKRPPDAFELTKVITAGRADTRRRLVNKEVSTVKHSYLVKFTDPDLTLDVQVDRSRLPGLEQSLALL